MISIICTPARFGNELTVAHIQIDSYKVIEHIALAHVRNIATWLYDRVQLWSAVAGVHEHEVRCSVDGVGIGLAVADILRDEWGLHIGTEAACFQLS